MKNVCKHVKDLQEMQEIKEKKETISLLMKVIIIRGTKKKLVIYLFILMMIIN